MKVFTLQILSLTHASVPVSWPLPSVNEEEDGTRVELLNQGRDCLGDYREYSVTWLEDRILSNVVTDGRANRLVVTTQRKVYARPYPQIGLMLTAHLRRQPARLLHAAWPTADNRPAFSDVRLNLRKHLETLSEFDAIQSRLEDIQIENLPLESITATHVHIDVASRDQIVDLLTDTQARIRRITFLPRSMQITSIRVSDLGTIRIWANTESLSVAIDDAVTVLSQLQLMECRHAGR